MTADVTDRKRVEEALLWKNAELAEAQRLAGVGSWQWDARTDTVIWSEELYRLVGRDPKLPAPSYKEQPSFFTAESWGRLQRAVEDALQNGTSYELDMEIVRSDFTNKWAVARGEPLRDEGGQIVGLRGTVQDITERKRAEDALSGFSRKLIEAQEQERTRIARELHDDIGQRLALFAIELEETTENLPDSAEKVRSRMEELRKRMFEISTDVQALSHELHSSKLQYLGVVAAMTSFCKEFGEQQKVEVDFIPADIPHTVPEEVSLCLFRVLQEALHNAVKHSGVRHFEVELRGASDAIHLTMRDLGLGFDPEGAMKGRGLGLTSMQERLKAVNGELSINSQPKRGTTIHACVPLISGTSSVRAAG
jgi:signal transduction histidine kinase